MDHKAVQAMGKATMEYIKTVLKPGMNLKEVRRLCEEKMLELEQIPSGIGMLGLLSFREGNHSFCFRKGICDL